MTTNYPKENIQLGDRLLSLLPYRRLAQMRTANTTRFGSWAQNPMFYAYMDSGDGRCKVLRKDFIFGRILLMVVCLIFGGVHLLAWFSDFPSHIEHLLWRTCSVAITVLPLIYVVPVLLLRPALSKHCPDLPCVDIASGLVKLILFVQLAIPPFYFIARLFLLIEMIISLRTLPSSAFMNVTWTTYFLHV